MKKYFPVILFFLLSMQSCSISKKYYERSNSLKFEKTNPYIRNSNVEIRSLNSWRPVLNTRSLLACSKPFIDLRDPLDSCDNVLMLNGKTISGIEVTIKDRMLHYSLCNNSEQNKDSIALRKVLMIEYADGRMTGIGEIGRTYMHPDKNNIYSNYSLVLSIFSIVALLMSASLLSFMPPMLALISIWLSIRSNHLRKYYPSIFKRKGPVKIARWISAISILTYVITLLVILI